MEIKIYEEQINGLKAAIKDLREKERLFIKANTLQEQAEKARFAIDKLTVDWMALKDRKAELKQKRADILKGALDPLANAITALLPRGEAILSLDETLFVGWKDGDRLIPYGGMSSGERVPFDSALSRALLKGEGLKIIVLESAEQDDGNLQTTLKKIIEVKDPSIQWIVNTWYAPKSIPDGWKEVILK